MAVRIPATAGGRPPARLENHLVDQADHRLVAIEAVPTLAWVRVVQELLANVSLGEHLEGPPQLRHGRRLRHVRPDGLDVFATTSWAASGAEAPIGDNPTGVADRDDLGSVS